MIIHQNIEVHRLWRHKHTTVYDIKHFKSRQRVAALLTSRHVTARSLIWGLAHCSEPFVLLCFSLRVCGSASVRATRHATNHQSYVPAGWKRTPTDFFLITGNQKKETRSYAQCLNSRSCFPERLAACFLMSALRGEPTWRAESVIWPERPCGYYRCAVFFFFFPIWSIFLLLHTHRHTHPHTGLHQLGKLNNRTAGGGGLQQKRDKLLRNPLPSFTITTYQ